MNPVSRQTIVSPRSQPIRAAARSTVSVVGVVLAVVWVFIAPEYQIFTASAAIPLAIASLGLLVLQGWAREISLASAGVFGTAIYFFGYLERPNNLGLGIPWLIAALIAIAAVSLLMVLTAAASGRLPGIYLVVITLGVQVTLEKTVFTQGRLSGGLSGGTERGEAIVNPRPWFFGLHLRGDTAFYFFLLGWLALVLTVMVRLRHSPAGRAFLLVGTDRQAAASVGISPLRYRLGAFAVSGALAGLAGVLACWLYINPPVFVGYLAPTSLLLLAIPVLAGRDAIGWVLAIAVADEIIPVALEQYRINAFLLAGVGLIGGAFTGPRGLGGAFADLRHRLLGDSDRAHLRKVAEGESAARDDVSAVVAQWLGHSPAAASIALEVRDVGVKLDGLTILDGVSLAVPTGAFVGLIGPNGAGKSTLFDVISGVRPPDHGTVQLFGTDVTGRAAWRRPSEGISRVFQSTRIIEDLSVADNLLLGAHHRLNSPTVAYLAGWPGAWNKSAAAERAARAIARLLEIEDRWYDRAGTLSFSGRRRIEIGRALLAGPRILLLDEPAAGLDPNAAGAMFALLRQLHSELGLTIVLIEHNVSTVLEVCELIHVLAAGRLLATGTPAQILDDPTVRQDYLGNRLRFVAPSPIVAATPGS
jgi:branched-chain amino acid transport system permease protein